MSEEIKFGKIEGVKYLEPKIHVDDRGFFAETAKEGDLMIDVKQANFCLTHPGVIKAFHWHRNQEDLWTGVFGKARAVLYDLRENSKTKGMFQEFFLGEPNYGSLLIPRGVAHGYQVIGNKDFGIFYMVSNKYNPENLDEERIDFDALGFDWGIRNR